jgi:hypothetical protein
MEQHTVEVSFEAEEISLYSGEYADLTLYRTAEDTYFVQLDARQDRGNAPSLITYFLVTYLDKTLIRPLCPTHPCAPPFPKSPAQGFGPPALASGPTTSPIHRASAPRW